LKEKPLKDSDFDAFAQLIGDTMDMYGKPCSPNQIRLYFADLQRYTLRTIESALAAHHRDTTRGRFAPLPADLLAQIETAVANDGRPSEAEAWPMALRANDERHTVVWTAETAEAFGICRPVLDAGDEVGARMAFKAAYSRLIAEARAKREPVRWSASLGHDQAQQDDTLRIAVEAGKLPAAYLPAPRGPVAGLLELSQQRGCPEHVRQRLEAIRAQIVGARPGEFDGADWHHKQRTIDLKAAAQAAVDAAMRKQGGDHGDEQ
jgi:hypothetical protein